MKQACKTIDYEWLIRPTGDAADANLEPKMIVI